VVVVVSGIGTLAAGGMSYFRSLLEAAMGDGDMPANLEAYEEAAGRAGGGAPGSIGALDEEDEGDDGSQGALRLARWSMSTPVLTLTLR
jgi:hypothetical protein